MGAHHHSRICWQRHWLDCIALAYGTNGGPYPPPSLYVLRISKPLCVQAADEWEDHPGEDGPGQQVLFPDGGGERGGNARQPGHTTRLICPLRQGPGRQPFCAT
jgi:hypothetical protein